MVSRFIASVFVLFSLLIPSLSFGNTDGELLYEVENFSVLSNRKFIPVRKYRVDNHRATILFVHGGGCMYNIFSQLPEYQREDLLELGFSIYEIDYTHGKQWKLTYGTKFDFLYNVGRFKDECASSTTEYLNEISEIALEVKKRDPNSPVILYGHSYGGYLVNLLMTKCMVKVDGVISSHGIWDVNYIPWFFKDSVIPMELNPIDGNSECVVKTLALHTKDDKNVPYIQIERMKSWMSDRKVSSDLFEPVLFENGLHFIDGESYPRAQYMEKILSFLEDIMGDVISKNTDQSHICHLQVIV